MNQIDSSKNSKFKELITEGSDGNVVLIGFPHDFGARNAGKNFGQEYGPDCMRRFLPNMGPTYNPEYDIDISSIKVTDYGNIELIDDKTLDNLQNKLIQKMTSIIQKNSIPIVIGGTKDAVYGALKALKNSVNETGSKIGLFAIQKFCDCSKYDQNSELNSTNGVLKFLTEYENSLNQIIYFSTEKYDNNLETNKFKHDFKNVLKFVHFEDIKKISPKIDETIENSSTRGGRGFLDNLADLAKTCNKIHLSVSLEAINSSDCPGVGNKSKQGLSSEEILEILFQTGKNPLISSVDITDYCPGSEDYRTGILLCNMIYYFIMGYKKRLESN